MYRHHHQKCVFRDGKQRLSTHVSSCCLMTIVVKIQHTYQISQFRDVEQECLCWFPVFSLMIQLATQTDNDIVVFYVQPELS